MTQPSDFYQVLGVPPGAEPAEIRDIVKERVDDFRRHVEEADDPDTVRNRLLLAYEVLTDEEERYLYELYGHDDYMDERLDGQEMHEVSGFGASSLTPVFSGEASTSDTEVFDPAADDTSDTEIFDPEASDAAVGGATTAIGSPEDGPGGPDGPTVDPDDDETIIRDDGEDDDEGDFTDGETIIKDEGDEGESPQNAVEESEGEPEDGDEDEQEDELAELASQKSIIDELSKFPLSESPLAVLPGIGGSGTNPLLAAGYGLVSLGIVFVAGMFLPFGSVIMGAAAGAGVAVGAATTYIAGSLKFDRRLDYRFAIGAGLAIAAYFALPLGLTSTTPASVLSFGTAAACLFGATASNTYIESTRARIREGRKDDDGRGGSNYTETDPTLGTVDDSIDAESVIESMPEQVGTRTSSVADDIDDESTVHSTRHFVPERHIERVLGVYDERTSKEVPVSKFSSVRSKLREDVHDRDRNHPSGFTERTDEYLVPSSVTERTCPKCGGSTTIQCPNCGGAGKVSCSKCGGDTRNKCLRCRGKGRDSDGNLCSSCHGDGYNPCNRCSATGVETCGTCSGSGIVTCDRCEGDGTVVQFTQLTREYIPEKEVTYKTESLPEELLHSPEGNQVKKERDENSNPDAMSGDWFFREHEVREIPTDVVTYEYAGDLWETYEMEDGVKAPTFPKALGTRVQALAVASVVFAGAMCYIIAMGPSGLP